jgi:hypothetical protein
MRVSSARAIGYRRSTAIRPASESARRGIAKTFADPVSKKRPGVRSRSTAAFSVVNSSGTRRTTSSVAGPGRSRTNPTGSAAAAARITSSSKVT